MLAFPNCKINLGLHILDKREDGFHNLETIFYPVPFRDALEVISSSGSTTEIEFTGTGLAVDGITEDNLCIKAYHLLKKYFPDLPSVKIHLHKALPIGAGLGGGSADAAFMLKMLNEKFKLNLSTPQLLNYALQLGSDCPFFLINKPCFATGRGEVLEEIAVDLSSYKIIFVNPGIHINTGWAFSNITPGLPSNSIKEIIQQPVSSWKAALKNDFENPVFAAHPAIKAIKETLYKQGAIYAAMSGSGSTVFGIFSSAIDLAGQFPAGYFAKMI
jgi:4-diphosphocytidyl-2-C-methyl-D-erythritol kinase